MKGIEKTDCKRPSLLPSVLEMDDNVEYNSPCSTLYMSPCPTSVKSPEILERLQRRNEEVQNPFWFPSPHTNQQRYSQPQIGPDIDCNYSMCNLMCKSKSIPNRVKGTAEKELQAILRELRVITDKVRQEVL